MSRLAASSITVYSLGGTDYLGYVASYNFDGKATLASCKGITARHDVKRETKRTLTFSGEHKRRTAAGAACETMQTISALSFNGGSVKADVRGGSFKFTNANFRADGGGDVLAQVKLTGTTTEGTLELFINDTDTTTLLSAFANGDTITTSLTLTDGVGTVTQGIMISGISEKGEIDGGVMVTATFEGTAAPSAYGGGLFATGFNGTGAVSYSYDNSIKTITGNAVILSGEIKFNADEITMESYSFHQNTATVSAP